MYNRCIVMLTLASQFDNVRMGHGWPRGRNIEHMRIEKILKKILPLLILVSIAGLARANAGTTGELWFGSQGPATNTASGVSDNRVGYINTDGVGFVTVETDPSTNSFYSVGLDTNANLYFALASDGTLR